MFKIIKEILSYVVIILVVLLIRTYIGTPVRVNGTSMDTTLKNGEIMILNKIKYRFKDIKRFDIVVVNYNGEKLIKRVTKISNFLLKFHIDLRRVIFKQVLNQLGGKMRFVISRRSST